VIYASAPGKLNLFFEVGALRADGYHPVISIYQSLAIRQRVGVEASDRWEVSTTGNLPQQQLDRVPTDQSNLCVIAAKELARYAGIQSVQPMKFFTQKEVPVAAGLAGGSADAAASLLALNQAWDLNLSFEQLTEVASKVGSDVPFSLLGGTALGLDTGIQLRKLEDLPVKHVVLLVSPIGLSTREVFRTFDEMFPKGDINQSAEMVVEGLSSGRGLGKNSLLQPALKLREELEAYQHLIEGTKGYLSGSGPTIYFITEDRDQATAWNQKLASLGHFTILTTTSTTGALLG
jgi:4-diphosphocytidyl-2C-methyl-D-erythritol kinase